jgi:carbamoyl-phosphate synthase large subunit
MIPTARSFKGRSKSLLSVVADQADVLTPQTVAVHSPKEAGEWTNAMGGKAIIKGPFYDASRADSPAHATSLAARILAEWGGPILVQQAIYGEEYDLLSVGDGQGGSLGSCAIKKLIVSSRGKGYAGITVHDEALTLAGDRLMKALTWLGPWECEFIRDRAGDYYLIEINPRFPAWADFPAAIGLNLVAKAVLQVLGHSQSAIAQTEIVPAGKVFLRHSTDLVCDAEIFSKLAIEGQSIRSV